jgi:hypothetical protein
MTAPEPLAWLDALADTHTAAHLGTLRVGQHYDIHLYAGQDPVGTTLRGRDAAAIVAAHNALPELLRLVRERYALEAAVLALAEEHEKWARINRRLALEDTGGPDVHDGMRMAQEASATRIRSTVAAALAGPHTTDEEDDLTASEGGIEHAPRCGTKGCGRRGTERVDMSQSWYLLCQPHAEEHRAEVASW